MRHNVICISRTDGSRAQEIASSVAKRLGFRLIAEDIVERAAVEAGVEREVIADIERGRTALVRLIEGFGPTGAAAGYFSPTDTHVTGRPAGDELRGLIRSVIEEVAAEGSAVILAHAASLALAGHDDVLRVLVTASPEIRAQRVASTCGTNQKQAARAIQRSDADRADYIKRFYRVSSELPTHYDLLINTDRLTPDQAARVIAEATLEREPAAVAAR
jgi:cytidylate kinase